MKIYFVVIGFIFVMVSGLATARYTGSYQASRAVIMGLSAIASFIIGGALIVVEELRKK